MIRLVSTSIFALVIGVSGAYASDLSLKDSPGDVASPGRAVSWTGPWIGIAGGYDFANDKLTESEHYGDESGKISVDGLGSQGLFGELQLGYDRQLGNRPYVISVFGGLNLNDNEFSIDASGGGEHVNILSIEQEWGGVLGARVGMLKSPDTMFYVGGGWAFGKMGDVKSDGEKVFDDQETDLSGWFGELGMETRVYQNVYLSVAGRYTDYGSINLAHESGCEGECSASIDLDVHDLTVMTGLKIKLNGSLPDLGY